MKTNTQLKGQKIGQLTIIEDLADGKHRCICDCGKEVTFKTQSIYSSQKCNYRCPTTYIGQERFGAKITGVNPKTLSYILKCPKCGKEHEFPYSNLKRSNETSVLCDDCRQERMASIDAKRKSGAKDFFDNKEYFNIKRDENKNEGNKMKVRGVSFDNKHQKWRAVIYIGKRRVHLGYFEEFEEAANARRNAEVEYFENYTGESNLLHA